MTILSWFRSKQSTQGNGASGKGRRSFSHTTLPLISPRRGRRILRREQLFSIVRESMIRGGVLSTSYEFKVLSLDANADKFLVLVELALPADEMPDEYLLEIERWVQLSARSRLDMEVPAVYWRRKAAPEKKGTALHASVSAQTRREAQLISDAPASIPMPSLRSAGGRPQPVGADEVTAFRQALERPAPQLRRGPGVQVDVPPMEPPPEPEAHSDFAALSETQYGKL